MQFDKEKHIRILKKDKSKKGEIDKKIKRLINAINKLPNYYTTSSCSGRIMLLSQAEKKHKTEWFFVSHEKIKQKEFKDAIKKIKTKKDVWFRFEPMIVHIACRSIEDAQRIVDVARFAGFKKSGIIATSKRVIAEIRGTDFISTIVLKNGKLIADDSYLKVLVNEANKKIGRNEKKITKFYTCLFSSQAHCH